jgi:molybdenum cofactor guanylyltransferase
MSATATLPPFSAALLAGGLSTRMGRDKAGVLVEGVPLWEHQCAKLRALEPAEFFISGRIAGPYARAGVEIVPDAKPGLGPLAGLAAILRRATSPLVLVLAVDLPVVSVGFLEMLIAQARATSLGLVPRSERWFEPLAAVYPRAALPLVAQLLGEEDRSLQRLARGLIEAGLVNALPLDTDQIAQFRNVNTPLDLQT